MLAINISEVSANVEVEHKREIQLKGKTLLINDIDCCSKLVKIEKVKNYDIFSADLCLNKSFYNHYISTLSRSGDEMALYTLRNDRPNSLLHNVSELVIPLAGSELEQNRINSNSGLSNNHSYQSRTNHYYHPRSATYENLPTYTAGKRKNLLQNSNLQDYKSADGIIMLSSLKNGVKQLDNIKIIRPEISAAALKVLGKKRFVESSLKLGRTIKTELPSGIIVMSSFIFPLLSTKNSGEDKILFYRSPLFRVQEEGERLIPRPGRADDMQWPRPESLPFKKNDFQSVK
ncbi:MAG: hypothetical protein HRT83_06925 [Hyphomicrobiaceae bacterium]|nr:hypothetical protein [Hyphomicrobiaceae bacterium]